MKVAGTSLYLKNVLFVSGLGVNLLSSRKICAECDCLGTFNDRPMWFANRENELIIQANVKNGLCFASRFMPHFQGLREIPLICYSISPKSENNPFSLNESCYHIALTTENKAPENEPFIRSQNLGLSRGEKFDYYNLMHRRFDHMGVDQLRNLLKVTKLSRSFTTPLDKEIYRVYKLQN